MGVGFGSFRGKIRSSSRLMPIGNVRGRRTHGVDLPAEQVSPSLPARTRRRREG